LVRSDERKITVAIPVHNESETLAELKRRLDAVLSQLPGGPHSILFVDDGSTDDTLSRLEDLSRDDERVSVISLSRNFGHQAALTAALDHARGDAVVLMDGDLQDRPEAIPDLLREFDKGYDVVYAVRVGRKEGPVLRACYRLFYWLMARLSSTPLPEGSGDFGLLSRRAVQALRLHREQHRYMRGLRALVGFRQIGIEVERDPRYAGSSRYGFGGLLRLAFDGLFSFSVIPIRAAAVLGAVAIGGSVLYTIFALWAKLAGHSSPQGFTTLIITMIFLAGVQLLFLGIIGEYIGRVYHEAKQRPLYVVASRIGAEAESGPEGSS
jgi:dolichol-phosphate mannosyltransferase